METTYTQSSDMSCGVPQRREKRFGNGVKNLSGSADLPEWLAMEPAKRGSPGLRTMFLRESRTPGILGIEKTQE